jgi:hypothetical protein
MIALLLLPFTFYLLSGVGRNCVGCMSGNLSSRGGTALSAWRGCAVRIAEIFEK